MVVAVRQRPSLRLGNGGRCAPSATVIVLRQRQSLQLQAIETDYKKNE